MINAQLRESSPIFRIIAKSPSDRSLRIPHSKFREQTIDALRKTNLEWTQFHNSLFLDYYGLPYIESYLNPLIFAVDIANKTAAIPGSTGNEIISFTYTKDLAKFVVAALGLPKWDEAFHCYSDNATWNEVIQIAEETTGEHRNSGKVNKSDSKQEASSMSPLIPSKRFSATSLLSFHLINACMSIFQSQWSKPCCPNLGCGPSLA